jgi:hypothetical protein
MRTVAVAVGILREWARALGPYVMLEILLPGGTLIALILLLVRRRRRAAQPG